MGEPTPGKQPQAQIVQEAIDVLFSEFSYPDAISIETGYNEGVKNSAITVLYHNNDVCYRLRYDGWNDSAEPELKKTSE